MVRRTNSNGLSEKHGVIDRARARSLTAIVMYRAHIRHNCPRNLFTVRAPIVEVNAITYRAWSNVAIKNY